jgi:hypothetical protein
MNTFLPYPSFEESARALDDKRLPNQVNEALVIYKVLRGETNAWKHHPAVLMWKGYVEALLNYRAAMMLECGHRGIYRNWTLLEPAPKVYNVPFWLGDQALHASHRSNLLRKRPEWYGRLGWVEGPDLPYVWPVRCSDVTSSLRAAERADR